MQILPVVDLLGGQVVRAVRGERSNYRPLESPRIAEPTAKCVGEFLAKMCGFREAYVADLDLIQGGKANLTAWQDLFAAGLSLWIDAGLNTAVQGIVVFNLLNAVSPASRIIAGLETLAGPEGLASLNDRVGAEHVVFSLDLRDGQPIHSGDAWAGMSPAEIAQAAINARCRTILLLDLADVGTGRGLTTLPLLEHVRRRNSEVEWWVGGGIASPEDLAAAEAAGASGCLVGSAIYDGKI